MFNGIEWKILFNFARAADRTGMDVQENAETALRFTRNAFQAYLTGGCPAQVLQGRSRTGPSLEIDGKTFALAYCRGALERANKATSGLRQIIARDPLLDWLIEDGTNFAKAITSEVHGKIQGNIQLAEARIERRVSP